MTLNLNPRRRELLQPSHLRGQRALVVGVQIVFVVVKIHAVRGFDGEISLRASRAGPAAQAASSDVSGQPGGHRGGVTTAVSVGVGGSGGGFEAQAAAANVAIARAERLSIRIVISLLVPVAPPKKARIQFPGYYLRIAIELQDWVSVLTRRASI